MSHREALNLSSHRIDPATGGLSQTGSVDVEDWPAYIATDRTGRHLTVAFYGGARAGVYPIGADGELGGAPTESLTTADGAHAILTDRSNRFAYVPHIAYIQDNVLEPPKNIPGPNVIHQFRFDADTGRLTPNDPPVLEMDGFLGPRHYTYHPSLDVVYFSDEQGSSVTAYNMDSRGQADGLPDHLDAPGRPHRAQHLLPDTDDARRQPAVRPQPGPQQHSQLHRGRGNRRADRRRPRHHRGRAQRLQPGPAGQVRVRRRLRHRTPQLPQHQRRDTGEMTPLATYDVGARPMWVLTTTLGE